MPEYDRNQTLRDARARYFDDNGFGDDGGYSKRWVKFEVGRIPLAFPNLPSRVRAVKIHDLDHILTGYGTSLVGEAEISGYEIGCGCGDYAAGWFLNLQTFFAGLFMAPRRLFTAYRRGLQCKSLFHEEFNDALLDERVGAAQVRLGLDHPLPDSVPLADRMSFAGWSIVSSTFSLAGLLLVLAPLYGLALLLF